jgi:hypothetical protein
MLLFQVLIADICTAIPHVLLVEVLQYVARSLVEDRDRDGDVGGGGGEGTEGGGKGGGNKSLRNRREHRATVGLGATRHVPEAVQLSRRLLGQQDGTPEEMAAAAGSGSSLAREGRTKRMFDENIETCIAMVEILWSLAMSPVLGESRTRGGGGGHRASSTGGDDPADPMHNDVAFVQLYVSRSILNLSLCFRSARAIILLVSTT